MPIILVLLPNTTNAIRIPTPMFSTVSQISPIPRFAATPPNPTIADVLMNVAPYERAITTGWLLRPATRKSSATFVCLYPIYPMIKMTTR